jgi:TolB-like protein
VLKPLIGDLFDELAAPSQAAASHSSAPDKPITLLEPKASAEVNLPRSEKVVLMVDLVESVRLMAVDETGTISRWHRFISNAQTAVLPAHQGRMVKSLGDGLLAEFEDCKQAVEAAFALHASLQDEQIGISPNQAMRMRAGIHSTHVWRDSTDIYGAGVNLAARLSTLANPGETVVSEPVYAQMRQTMDVLIEDLGECQLRHIDQPVRAYRVGQPAQAATTPALGTRPSLAVLPFSVTGGGPDEEYFGDGLAEDIIASLARSPWLFVIARGSSFTFRGDDLRVSSICKKLGVRYLVMGSVRKIGTRIRASAELLDGSNGETLWSERYDRDAQDFFELQDDIVSKIVGTIEPLFLRQEERQAMQAAQSSGRDSAASLAHWDLLMRARWHYWRSTRRHSEETKRLLEQAIAMRPNDVAGLSLLSFSLFTDVWSGWAADPKAVIERGMKLAVRALSIDERDSFAHFTMGVAAACVSDMPRAIAAQRQAIKLYPHFAAAEAELGRLLVFQGETAEAVAHVNAAIVASPSDPRMSLWLFTLSMGAFIDKDFDAACTYAAQAIAQRSDWFFNHYLYAACLAATGDVEAAQRTFKGGQKLMPNMGLATLKVGHPFSQKEHRDRYVDALRKAGWEG